MSTFSSLRSLGRLLVDDSGVRFRPYWPQRIFGAKETSIPWAAVGWAKVTGLAGPWLMLTISGDEASEVFVLPDRLGRGERLLGAVREGQRR